MLFSLVVALMIILIAAFWTYQGMFSAAIMFFEAVIAAMVAFAFYESVNELWVDSIGEGIGLPLALMLLFAVVLGLLRGLTDRYIDKDVQMPVPVARAGGAIFGFFSGMVMVGMVMIAIQMLPIGSEVFSFERMSYNNEKGGPTKAGSLGFFGPDRFTYGLVSMLSDGGRFGTDKDHSLRRTKPDLIDQLYSARAVPQSEARVFLPENALKVKAWWTTDDKIDLPKHKLDETTGGKMVREFESTAPDRVGNKFLVCTVHISNKAAPENKGGEIRFRLPQFRVVGFDHGTDAEDPSVYLATGITDLYTHRNHGPMPVTDGQRERLVKLSPFANLYLSSTTTKVLERDGGYQFEVAFEVPGQFKPWFIEFKSGARADLSVIKPSESRPSWASVAQGTGGVSGSTVLKAPDPVGPITGSVWDVAVETKPQTGFSSLLPLQVPPNDPAFSRFLTDQKLGIPDGMHTVYTVPDARSSQLIDELYVPPGKQMFQISFNDPQKQSMWGRAIQFSKRVVADTYINDAEGNRYDAIGQYAIAMVDGKWTYEIQYWPNAEMPERVLKANKPKKVTQAVLDRAGQNGSFFGFIFVLPDTVTEIKTFQSGAGKPLDLNISR